MSLIVDYSVSAPTLPLIATAAAAPDASVDLHRILVTGDGPPVFFVWVTATRFDRFERALDRDDTVRAFSLLESDGEQRLYRVTVDEAFIRLKAAFVETGAAPDTTHITGEGWHARARFPDRESLLRFRDSCTEHDVRFRLERLYHADGANEASGAGDLTDKQREALVLAYEHGYFELPKRTSLGDLAGRLGVSKTAFSNRLRRAVRRVVENSLADRSPSTTTED